jgi:folate-dependent phosphoribosylglycinamide formyltransferase PurN
MNTSISLVKPVDSPKLKVLFLGYTKEQTRLVEDLVNSKCEVWHTEEKIVTTQGYDLVVSYGYRHILKKDVIESSSAPIINLHISYLPWNRGAHPNFWSFYDSTPSGVTIHLIDEGVDTGAIIYQRMVNFNKDENTFSKTYKRLIIEIENLFIENLDEIISMNFTSIKQRRKGTYHRVADLPEEFSGWDSNIQSEVIRLDGILIKK